MLLGNGKFCAISRYLHFMFSIFDVMFITYGYKICFSINCSLIHMQHTIYMFKNVQFYNIFTAHFYSLCYI